MADDNVPVMVYAFRNDIPHSMQFVFYLPGEYQIEFFPMPGSLEKLPGNFSLTVDQIPHTETVKAMKIPDHKVKITFRDQSVLLTFEK